MSRYLHTEDLPLVKWNLPGDTQPKISPKKSLLSKTNQTKIVQQKQSHPEMVAKNLQKQALCKYIKKTHQKQVFIVLHAVEMLLPFVYMRV